MNTSGFHQNVGEPAQVVVCRKMNVGRKMNVVHLALLLACVFGCKATSCSLDFYELEGSLLRSAENRFSLLKAFYSPRQPRPVVVKITYSFSAGEEEELTSPGNASRVWYWSESGFYLIQPLEVFQCTSLLFSNLVYMQRELDLQLPANCSSVSEEFLEMLTSRMKLYAQSPTTSPSSSTLRISDAYIATAASEAEMSSDSLQSVFVKVWLHLTLFLFPLGSLFVLYICDPVQLMLGDKTWFILEDEHAHGTIAAIIQIAILIIFYIFIMDLAGIYFTITTTALSAETHSAFYLSTMTGVFIDLIAFAWVLFVLFYSIMYVIKSLISKGTSLYLADRLAYNKVKKFLTSTTLAAVLSFFNHIHYIILAFISDPFHAGSTAIMFIAFFFIFYIVFRQFYNRVVLHSNKHPGNVAPHKLCNQCISNLEQKLKAPSRKPLRRVLSESQAAYLVSAKVNKKCDCFISGPGCHTPFSVRVVLLSLSTVCPFLLVYVGMITVLFFNLPLTKSIEDSPSRLYSIYQGTGLIIVALLAYNIVLRPNSFSVVKVMERLAKRLKLPDHTNYWNKLTDEEKCAKVISTLMEKNLRTELHKTLSDDSDEESIKSDGGRSKDTVV